MNQNSIKYMSGSIRHLTVAAKKNEKTENKFLQNNTSTRTYPLTPKMMSIGKGV